MKILFLILFTLIFSPGAASACSSRVDTDSSSGVTLREKTILIGFVGFSGRNVTFYVNGSVVLSGKFSDENDMKQVTNYMRYGIFGVSTIRFVSDGVDESLCVDFDREQIRSILVDSDARPRISVSSAPGFLFD